MRIVALAFLLASIAAAQEPVRATCIGCHTTVGEDFDSHKHAGAGLDCSTCHGVSERHIAAAGAAEPDRIAAPHQVAALCGTCHAKQAEVFAESAHGKLVASMSKTRAPNCGTCHDVHRLRPARAMERRCANCHKQRPEDCSAQPAVAAAVSCAGCHAPHLFAKR